MADNKETIMKQLLFRSQHRGVREMDTLLGRFAADHLATLDDALLDEYARLLDLPDPDAFAWLTGQAAPPADAPLNIIAFIRKVIAG